MDRGALSDDFIACVNAGSADCAQQLTGSIAPYCSKKQKGRKRMRTECQNVSSYGPAGLLLLCEVCFSFLTKENSSKKALARGKKHARTGKLTGYVRCSRCVLSTQSVTIRAPRLDDVNHGHYAVPWRNQEVFEMYQSMTGFQSRFEKRPVLGFEKYRMLAELASQASIINSVEEQDRNTEHDKYDGGWGKSVSPQNSSTKARGALATSTSASSIPCSVSIDDFFENIAADATFGTLDDEHSQSNGRGFEEGSVYGSQDTDLVNASDSDLRAKLWQALGGSEI